MLRMILQFLGISVLAFVASIVFISGVRETSFRSSDLVYKIDPETANTAAVSSTFPENEADVPEVTGKEITLEEKPAQSAVVSEPPAPQNMALNKEVVQASSPYDFPPKSFETLNTDTRGALVNILCSTSGTTLRPISGSG